MKIIITNCHTSNSSNLFRIIFCVALFFVASNINFGQNVQHPGTNVDSMTRGDFRVDPLTGGLSLSIPIRAYAGRGSTGIPINIIYSSKVWQMDYQDFVQYPDCGAGGFCPPNDMNIYNPRFADQSASGWTIGSVAPKGKADEQIFDAQGRPCTSGTCLQHPYHIDRFFIQMPDGSKHEFRKDDGFHPGNTPSYGTYYSVNSTGMRFEYGGQNSTLYLPNGDRYIWAQTGNEYATKFIDRNGNTINAETGGWRDTLGRLIPLPPVGGNQAPAVGDYNYIIPGFNTSTQTYTFKWRKLEDVRTNPNQPLHYTGDYDHTSNNVWSPALFGGDGENRFAVTLHNPVVLHELVLPDGRSYKFTYNIFGEIDKVIYPTGAYERYTHGYVPPKESLTYPYYQANRGVTARWISPSGNGNDEQQWSYSYTTGRTTQPDGTIVERHFHTGRPLGDPGLIFDFDLAIAGKQYDEKVFAPGDVIKTRTLTKWEQLGPLTFGGVSGNIAARRDPFPSKDVSIVFEGNEALMQMTEYDYDSNADPTYFAHRNIKRVKMHRYVVVAKSTAETATIDTLAGYFSPQTVEKTMETDYFYDLDYKARNINSLRVETRVLDKNGAVAAKSQIAYDESGFSLSSTGTMPANAANSWVDPVSELGGAVGNKRGLPTTVRGYSNPAANQYIETHSFYDQYGNLRKTRDARNNESEIQYDDDYAFALPTKTISVVPDPTGVFGSNTALTSETTYDLNSGLPSTTKDANGLETRFEYVDVLLRLTKVSLYHNNQQVGSQTLNEYGAGTSDATRFVKTRTLIDDARWKEGYTWFDGLGRTIKTQSVDSNGDVFAETEYDNMGRVQKVSGPYRNGEIKLWTTNTYEAGRLKEVTMPDGAKIITDYGVSTSGVIGITRQITDQAGKKRKSISDAFDRMVRIIEDPTGQNPLSTDYVFDTLGKLRKTIQGEQNRYFAYDNLGRLLYARQPEQNTNGAFSYTDPVTGNTAWSAKYEYDNNGNTTKIWDAGGGYFEATYDNLDRLTKKNYSDPATPDVEFYYDGYGLGSIPNFAKGKNTKITSSVSETRYTSFDVLGNLLTSEQRTPFSDSETISTATPRVSTYQYDTYGKLVNEIYPSGRTVKVDYDQDGEVSRIWGTVGANNRLYANGFSYNSAGVMERMRLGNGRWENYSYNSRQQITEIGLGYSAADKSLLKLEYGYGSATENNGNLRSQKISFNGLANSFEQTYSSDSLNRLDLAEEKVNGVTTWKQDFIYDRYGNRRFDAANTTTLGSCSQAVCNPLINTSDNRFSSGQNYSYDAKGNLTQDATGQQFIYDAENHQKEVKNSQGQTIGLYLYDGEGKRVKKISATETTIFVYNGGGQVVAEYSTQTTQTPQISYLTQDQLGSPRLITNQNGQVTTRKDYLPFGEEAGGTQRSAIPNYDSSETRKGYTGYEKDTESGLEFAQARYYNSTHGRFTSIDPLTASADAKNPQTLNRFVYTTNNPMTLVDPSGLIPGDDKKLCLGCGYDPHRPPRGKSVYLPDFDLPDDIKNDIFKKQRPLPPGEWSFTPKKGKPFALDSTTLIDIPMDMALALRADATIFYNRGATEALMYTDAREEISDNLKLLEDLDQRAWGGAGKLFVKKNGVGAEICISDTEGGPCSDADRQFTGLVTDLGEIFDDPENVVKEEGLALTFMEVRKYNAYVRETNAMLEGASDIKTKFTSVYGSRSTTITMQGKKYQSESFGVAANAIWTQIMRNALDRGRRKFD